MSDYGYQSQPPSPSDGSNVPNETNYQDQIEQEQANRMPPNGRPDNEVLLNGGGRTEVLTLIYIAFAMIAAAYLAIMIAFLIQVVSTSNFLYGYYRPELKPGPFTNDRYNWVWVFMLLSLIRTPLPLAVFFTFQNAKVYFPREMLFTFVNILFWFDVVILITLGVMYCAFCNQCGFRNGICDAPLEQYCIACWEQQPGVCSVGPSPPPSNNVLRVSPAFWFWLDYTAVWIVMDFLISRGLILVTKFMKYDYYRSSFYY